MFEHRFLPLKNDDSFRNPPPPLKDNHRACDHNAMLAFPQEQISHYTTGGGCMQPQVSQIGRRLHLSELKNRERQSH